MRKICVFALVLSACAAAFGQENGDIAPNEERIAAVADGSVTEALASWWGFSAEDATVPLQAALDSGVKVLRVDKQSAPWTVTPLTIPSDIEVVIDPGVTIQAKEGSSGRAARRFCRSTNKRMSSSAGAATRSCSCARAIITRNLTRSRSGGTGSR